MGIGGGLVAPPLSPVGGNGSGGPTNGQTAAQVATQINNSNTAVFASTYINQQSGVGTLTVLTTPTFVGGAYTTLYTSSGATLRSNSIPPFDFLFFNTNGQVVLGTNGVNKITLKPNGDITMPQANGGTLTAQTGNFGQSISAASGNSGIFQVSAAGAITSGYYTAGSGKTNIVFFDQSGNLVTNDLTAFIASLPGGGSSIPSVLGIVTNTAGGVIGVSTAVPGTWVAAGTLPVTSTDNSWMPLTNAVAYTNGPPTPGQALVVAGAGTNSYGAVLVKGTNFPSGGGSQTPWLQNIDASQFTLFGLNIERFTNQLSGSSSAEFQLYTNSFGAVLALTNGINNAAPASTAISADFFVAKQSVVANGGSVSLIPTNASVVLTSNGVAATLPFGVTNVLEGRAQSVIQYYVVDAVTGTPIMTISNETSGVKFRISYGALALIETNFYTLPVMSTNTIWRIRDESSGSGASVGIVTNWLIGL